jgi:hypothetical protein
MKIYSKANSLLAAVIKLSDINTEKNFVTENEEEFQLASFNLVKDTKIERHHHPKQNRQIQNTSEVITVIEGSIEVSIYDENLEFVHKENLVSGETIALFRGGHEIEVIEDTKFIESKQGPYIEDIDKIRF